ncbi:MAG: hypothetical protein AAB262_09615 [Elusimicrobiota bacterium]
MKNRMKPTLIATLASLLAAAALAQSSSFSFAGPVSRVITPNGDLNNDTAFIRFCNPADSDVSGRIYTLLGAEVAVLGPRLTGLDACPAGSPPNYFGYLTWDGRSNGTVVGSGIYVYRIQAESRIYSGTILVVR